MKAGSNVNIRAYDNTQDTDLSFPVRLYIDVRIMSPGRTDYRETAMAEA